MNYSLVRESIFTDTLLKTRKKIAFLVPAHNESIVIKKTIDALLKITNKEDIFVVDDGSVDNTSEIAQSMVPNVLTIQNNCGKATVSNLAIGYFGLADKYEYILPMDADTVITDDFLQAVLPILIDDTNYEIACVVGKVIGSSQSWVTTFRLWEYEVAQTIHKAAQSEENAIIVCPGCATIYRAAVFNKINIPVGTLTEDMDLTFQIHRQKLGKIVYSGKALVVTQDPLTVKDLLKQIDRWYVGFWQCVVKNNIPWGGQMLDLEVAMLALEGLFNGVLVLSLFFLIPIAIYKSPNILLIPILVDLSLFLIPTMLLTAYRHKSWKIFTYIPHFYFARILCCLVFLKSFVKVVLGNDATMGWGKATRYKQI